MLTATSSEFGVRPISSAPALYSYYYIATFRQSLSVCENSLMVLAFLRPVHRLHDAVAGQVGHEKTSKGLLALINGHTSYMSTRKTTLNKIRAVA